MQPPRPGFDPAPFGLAAQHRRHYVTTVGAIELLARAAHAWVVTMHGNAKDQGINFPLTQVCRLVKLGMAPEMTSALEPVILGAT